jgi:transposase
MIFAVYFPFYYLGAMFIREVKKKNTTKGKAFCQYQLVQASRIEGKVKQRSILYLGSEPLLANPENRKNLLDVLQAKIFRQPLLFAQNYPKNIMDLAGQYYTKFLIKYKDIEIGSALSVPPLESQAQMEAIDVNSIEIEGSRTFGGEHLCSQVMEMLNLGTCLESLGFSKAENRLAHISIIGRALFTASEHKTVQYLTDNSGLCGLHHTSAGDISHRDLYPITDKLYGHKDKIDKFLYNRIETLFAIKDSLVIYDLSNTYFEGRKAFSKRARYGKSKERRNDCKQIVFTGVINAQGFIRYSRIYDGNTADTVTLKDMIADLKKHSGPHRMAGHPVTEKTVVMDAGFASEENLEYLGGEGIKYVCVSRKRIKDYRVDKGATVYTLKDRRDNPIELAVFNPEGHKDTWMYVKSEQKRVKEQSMADKLSQRFEEELESLARGIDKKGTVKKTEKVWEKIGRLKQKHRMASGKYTVEVEAREGKATRVSWERKQQPHQGAQNQGVYFIRTNYEKPREAQLWNIYNTIREVESTFRCLKTDLQIRPIYHQKDERAESHIYLTILAYQMVNTIRYMLKEKGINHDWQNIVRIMNTQTIQSLILPTETKKIGLTKPSRPIKEALEIYQATNTRSMIPAKKKYVVYH